MKVGITEAKRNLVALVRRAASGEDIVVCKRGKPVAHLYSYAKYLRQRRARKGKSPAGNSGKKIENRT